MQTDVDTAMSYLQRRADTATSPIVLYGQSLGAAAAIYYAARGVHCAGVRSLVAESSFASYRGIALEKLAGLWLTWPLQWLPVLTISDTYSPVAVIGRVAPTPILIVHGTADRIVPLADAKRLFAAAHEPKRFWEVLGAGHIAAFRSAGMRRRLVSYLRGQVCPASMAASPAH